MMPSLGPYLDGTAPSGRLRKAFDEFTHDLANAALVIGWLSDHLENPHLSLGEIEHARESRRSSIHHAADLVRSFLARAIFAEPPSAASWFVDPVPLTRAAGHLVWLSPSRHRFELTVIEPVPLVSVDPTILRRVLENVCRNAVKYSPEGSTVRVSLQGSLDGGIEWLIADEGDGVPENCREAIFNGHRVAANSAVPGKGLGLAFARGAFRTCGGDIRVEAKAPRGSVFRLTLPTVTQAVAA